MLRIICFATAILLTSSSVVMAEEPAPYRLEKGAQNFTVYAGSPKRIRLCAKFQPISVFWTPKGQTILTPNSCLDVESDHVILGNQGVVAAEGTYAILSP